MVADRLRELEEAGVNRVRVHYTDLIGTTRAKVIPLGGLEQTAAGRVAEHLQQGLGPAVRTARVPARQRQQ